MKTLFDPVEATTCLVDTTTGEAWPVTPETIRTWQAELTSRGVACDLRPVPDTEVRAWEEVRRLRTLLALAERVGRSRA